MTSIQQAELMASGFAIIPEVISEEQCMALIELLGISAKAGRRGLLALPEVSHYGMVGPAGPAESSRG